MNSEQTDPNEKNVNLLPAISRTGNSDLLALFLPLVWGALTLTIYSGVPKLLGDFPNSPIPIWIVLWLVCLVLFVPAWRWILRRQYNILQRNTLQIAGRSVPLGSPLVFLAIAYIAAFSAVPFHSTWYGQWLVFGGIVSPIIEEVFSRHLLSPWLKRSFIIYFGVAILSALAFSLMHWGFGSGSAFSMNAADQIQKLWGHFSFAIILSFVFRWSRSLLLIILLHAASNIQFLLTKL